MSKEQINTLQALIQNDTQPKNDLIQGQELLNDFPQQQAQSFPDFKNPFSHQEDTEVVTLGDIISMAVKGMFNVDID